MTPLRLCSAIVPLYLKIEVVFLLYIARLLVLAMMSDGKMHIWNFVIYTCICIICITSCINWSMTVYTGRSRSWAESVYFLKIKLYSLTLYYLQLMTGMLFQCTLAFLYYRLLYLWQQPQMSRELMKSSFKCFEVLMPYHLQKFVTSDWPFIYFVLFIYPRKRVPIVCKVIVE